MNNKKGGFLGKFILVLILMLASAVGGAYAYRIADAKLAAKDAIKEIHNFDIDDYDAADSTSINEYIEDALKELDTVKSREAVYDILIDFKKDVDRIPTKSEREAEQARQASEQQNNNSILDRLTDNDNSNNSNGVQSTEDDNDSTGLFHFGTDDEE